MIAPDSVLRQLPPGLDRKQAFFFDGLRHAAEISALAYSRLQSVLTQLAFGQIPSEAQSHAFTSAFLDAWAVVDAIDRFRALWKLLPLAKSPRNNAAGPTLDELTHELRKLRNVADHLAQRADYVISKKSAALGVLSWVTVLDPQAPKMITCAIIPGTLQTNAARFTNPSDKEIELPTGLIHLQAGEHYVCISALLPEIERRVRHLEAFLDRVFTAKGIRGDHAAVDSLIVLEWKAEIAGPSERNPDA